MGTSPAPLSFALYADIYVGIPCEGTLSALAAVILPNLPLNAVVWFR